MYDMTDFYSCDIHLTKISPKFYNFANTFRERDEKIIQTQFICADRKNVEVCASFCFMWVGPRITEILTINMVQNSALLPQNWYMPKTTTGSS